MRDGPWVGVDIGGTKQLLVALRQGGHELHRVPTGPGTSLESIQREVRSFLTRLDALPAALGIGVPGLVDKDGAVTTCGTFPSLEGWRPDEVFSDLGCPVRALNDVDAALVEETHDLAPGATVALVMSGTWIGAAVWANGALLRGARGWAGEFGFAPVATENGGVVRLDDLAGAGRSPAGWARMAPGCTSALREVIPKRSPPSERREPRWASGWQRS